MRLIQKELIWVGEACRQAALRLTPQRLEIFYELAEATDSAVLYGVCRKCQAGK